MSFIGIVLLLAVVCFAVWQIVGIVKDIKAKKKKASEKQDEINTDKV